MKTAEETKIMLRQAIRELRRFSNGEKSSPSTEVVIDKLWKEYEKYASQKQPEELSDEEAIDIAMKKLHDSLPRVILPFQKQPEVTEERINQCIHDICVLQERIASHYYDTSERYDQEIKQLQARQHEAIINLISGK